VDQEAEDQVDELQEPVGIAPECGRSVRTESSSKTYISNLEKQLRAEREHRIKLEQDIKNMQK
jgi:hypothetical protein